MTGVVLHRSTVYPADCDHMGHMNVARYVSRFDHATWALFTSCGLTPSFLRRHNRGMAAVQMNLTYENELLPGDVISITGQIDEVHEKRIHFTHVMRHDETGLTAATCAVIALHTDLSHRKSTPFTDEILQRIKQMMTG